MIRMVGIGTESKWITNHNMYQTTKKLDYSKDEALDYKSEAPPSTD